jgi:hypothetical protein
MPLTGFAASTITNALTGAGVLYHSVAGVATLLGASRGGFTLEPNPTFRTLKVDGVREEVVGQREAPTYSPVLKGKLLILTDTVAQRFLLPGGTSAAGAVGEGNVITPKAAGTMLVDGDFVTNLRWVIDKTDPAAVRFAEVHFPRAICEQWSVAGTDEEYTVVDVSFRAVKADLATPIFNLKPVRTALPTT